MSKAWVATEDGWIDDGDGKPVVQYAGCGSHEAEWPDPAAKRLVLAAPKMLAVLKKVLPVLEESDAEFGEESDVTALVRQIISDATGEQP